MTGKSVWQRVRQIWMVLGLTATAVFCVWSLVAYRPSGVARVAARGSDSVRVTRELGRLDFIPVGSRSSVVGFLFFPGALVDPTAYAPLASAVAEAGFDAVILTLPRRGVFGGADDPEVFERARALLGDSAAPRQWILAGHSRGAVVASQVASWRLPTVVGVVLIGTTHPRDVDLSDLQVPVVKVVGTRDGIARPAGVEANRHLLPRATRWVRIDGGNHSQFGWYGFQPGDRFATISAQAQRSVTITTVLDVLRNTARAP